MNSGGWLFLLCSWGSILGLLVFCIRRIIGKHGGLDADSSEADRALPRKKI